MILDEIAARTRVRVAQEEKAVGLEAVIRGAEGMFASGRGAHRFPFEEALRAPGMSFICEVKKASPSKGVIAEEFPYLDIAREYEAAGAAAVSVLTEPYYFQGDGRYLKEICAVVGIPALRKDFVVSEYQIYEAKTLGAAAVLLICAILDDRELKSYLELAHGLGMSALVEAHTSEEVERALAAGARVVGVNNRDLQTFRVDTQTSIRLRHLVPTGILFVSESGIRTREDVRALEEAGVDACLVGESLMRAADKRAALGVLSKTVVANGR
ncbi:MAG: indole-3-glycerol phosphate synthase TrpC [Lachnospiraceae bacterium]|jgi:indole-3-glycerol phosphate synthase|nr:indole-3-glycerol phosphate synthase TrpC [Lachnospiraceae bacterium]